MAKIKNFLSLFLCFWIQLYRNFFAGLFPKSCRFYPSCSSYALEALKIKGPYLGLLYIFKRICRCHPWHPGGYDPVEPQEEN
jgi:putative membrane protein insertion efficiency factor